MRAIDATKYGERILNIMACWNISPCLTDAERTKAVSNLEVALDVLAEMPTISPDSLVKRGRWEYYEGSTMVNPHFRRSVCGRPRSEHYAVNDFKFCPSCGALMED